MKNKNFNTFLLSILVSALLLTAAFSSCRPADNNPIEKDIPEQSETKQDFEEQTETGSGENEAITEIAEIMPISPEEVYDIIINEKDYYILDVRTEEEYNESHIEGAVLIPVQELESMLDILPQDIPIVVYCRSGNRSRTAAEILVNNGFDMVYDMGGINDWTTKGYPIIEEDSITE